MWLYFVVAASVSFFLFGNLVHLEIW